MHNESVAIKTVQVTTTVKRTTDCFRRRAIKQEDGSTESKVVRWEQEHICTANLQVQGDRVYHNGALIA